MSSFLHSIYLGFIHVLPFGLDHIAFIICIFLVSYSRKEILVLSSSFTIAHSITLYLALSHYISIASVIVEPIIALTILYSALENIFQLKTIQWRPFLIFFFGLIHGLGFANAFELSNETSDLIQLLIGFNLGIEFAQLSIIIGLYFILSKPFSQKHFYKTKVVQPISSLIACIAIFWFINRIF